MGMAEGNIGKQPTGLLDRAYMDRVEKGGHKMSLYLERNRMSHMKTCRYLQDIIGERLIITNKY